MATGPSTVIKALSLLEYFSESRPSIGLAEFSRISSQDKSTTLRLLAGLESKGFIEKNEANGTYNLGTAFLRFSQLREASFPLAEAVRDVLKDLSMQTGETAHASIVSGEYLTDIGSEECNRANRVIIEPGRMIPFHASASGLAYLAFAEPEIVEAALTRTLETYTSATVTDPSELRKKIAEVGKSGVSYSLSAIEEGVLSIAAPYFGPGGRVAGAVAVAQPASRESAQGNALIMECVKQSAQKLTELQGGTYPGEFPM